MDVLVPLDYALNRITAYLEWASVGAYSWAAETLPFKIVQTFCTLLSARCDVPLHRIDFQVEGIVEKGRIRTVNRQEVGVFYTSEGFDG